MPNLAVPANRHSPAFVNSTAAISQNLDILLADAALRLQAQLRADIAAHYPERPTTVGTGDGIYRGFAPEAMATATDAARKSQAFRAPVPAQKLAPHWAALEVPRGQGRWSGRIRQLRTLGILALAGSVLFLAGLGMGMYHAAPRRNGIDGTAAKLPVVAEAASISAPQPPADVTAIEQSTVATVAEPAPTGSGPHSVIGLASEEPAPPSLVASDPDMAAGARAPIAGQMPPPEPDPGSQSNEVNALGDRIATSSESVTAIEPGTSLTPDPAARANILEDASVKDRSPQTDDPPLPVPTIAAKGQSPPEDRTWVTAIKPKDRATNTKPSPRAQKTKDQIRYTPALMMLRDANAVLQVFIALQKRHAVLSDKTPEARPVDRDGQTWYKLHIGPAVSESEARATCEALGTEGQTLGCTVEVQGTNPD